MENFNIKRFARTARWTFSMHFKGVLSYAAGLSFAYLVLFFSWLYPLLKGARQLDYARLMSVFEKCSLAYLLIVIVSGTWIFADMRTTAQRITVKLLPASDVEKFLVRFIAVTLGAMVLAIAVFCVADILRIVVCLLAGVDYVAFGLPHFIRMISVYSDIVEIGSGAGDIYPSAVNFAALGWCVWAQSLYILGGTLLRRYQFTITSTVHALLFVALSAIVAYGSHNVGEAIMDDGLAPAFYAAGAVLIAVAAVNWWLSYKTFKRMQVINNKWINL